MASRRPGLGSPEEPPCASDRVTFVARGEARGPADDGRRGPG